MSAFDRMIQLIKLLSCNRKLILLGSNNKIEKILLMKDFIVDSVVANVDKDSLRRLFNDGCISSSEHYLVFLSTVYDEKLVKWLEDEIGIRYEFDCFFIKHKPITIVGKDCSVTPYVDHYGNKVSGNLKNVKITFYGYDSFVKIDGGYNNIEITIWNDSSIVVVNCAIMGLRIQCSDNVDARFESCYFENDVNMVCHSGISLQLGSHTHILKSTGFVLHNDVHVGEECILSRNCSVVSGYGQSIFDVNTRSSISKMDEPVYIGNHVLVGERTVLLPGTVINDGSIVLPQSVTDAVYPNNVMIAGTMATVIKKDIAWSRKKTNDISECGQYVLNTCNEKGE